MKLGQIIYECTKLQVHSLNKERYFLSKIKRGSSHCGSVVMNLTSIYEDVGSILGPTQWVEDPALL